MQWQIQKARWDQNHIVCCAIVNENLSFLIFIFRVSVVGFFCFREIYSWRFSKIKLIGLILLKDVDPIECFFETTIAQNNSVPMIFFSTHKC